MMQDLGNGQRDFFGTVIKTAGAAHPKKVFSVLSAGLKLGKRQDFHAMGGFQERWVESCSAQAKRSAAGKAQGAPLFSILPCINAHSEGISPASMAR